MTLDQSPNSVLFTTHHRSKYWLLLITESSQYTQQVPAKIGVCCLDAQITVVRLSLDSKCRIKLAVTFGTGLRPHTSTELILRMAECCAMLGGVYCPRAQPKTTPAMVAAESSPWLLENKQQQNQHTRLALQASSQACLWRMLRRCHAQPTVELRLRQARVGKSAASRPVEPPTKTLGRVKYSLKSLRQTFGVRGTLKLSSSLAGELEVCGPCLLPGEAWQWCLRPKMPPLRGRCRSTGVPERRMARLLSKVDWFRRSKGINLPARRKTPPQYSSQLSRNKFQKGIGNIASDWKEKLRVLRPDRAHHAIRSVRRCVAGAALQLRSGVGAGSVGSTPCSLSPAAVAVASCSPRDRSSMPRVERTDFENDLQLAGLDAAGCLGYSLGALAVHRRSGRLCAYAAAVRLHLRDALGAKPPVELAPGAFADALCCEPCGRRAPGKDMRARSHRPQRPIYSETKSLFQSAFQQAKACGIAPQRTG
eukprot:657975-Pleurochrysis_carterae.AAC.9